MTLNSPINMRHSNCSVSGDPFHLIRDCIIALMSSSYSTVFWISLYNVIKRQLKAELVVSIVLFKNYQIVIKVYFFVGNPVCVDSFSNFDCIKVNFALSISFFISIDFIS